MTAAWILTGMSGAGKRTALDALAKQGVECVDNLPDGLETAWAALPSAVPRAALIDARRGGSLAAWLPPAGTSVIFLDARDDVLRRRIAESTRPHPCAFAGNASAQISAERELIAPLRAAADVVIDTSDMTATELGARVCAVAVNGAAVTPVLNCAVSSFGFKYGLQTEADWVIDVRFLPNPFWVDELRPFTGEDPRVRDYVLAAAETQEFLKRLDGLLGWTLQQYVAKGRPSLHIAVGCTGGRHRSVVVANELARRIRDAGVGDVEVRHRDADKPDPR